MGSESIRGVAEDPFGFRCLGAYDREYGGPEFEYSVHKSYGSVVGWIMWICFVRFVYEFGGAGAPFVWCVAMFGHESEQKAY